MSDSNYVIIEGVVVHSPFKATIKGKEKVFFNMTTTTSVPTARDEDMVVKDYFRIWLPSEWMIRRCENIKVGDRLKIVGRASGLVKRIRMNGNVYNFNDTTIIPKVIDIPTKAEVADYTDYKSNIDTSKKNLNFKIPKND